MANTFKNASGQIGTTPTTIYTAPASTTAVIHAIYVGNVHASGDATVDIAVTDTSNSATFYISKNLDVPNGSTVVFEKPINLETTDALKLTASAAGRLEVFVSVLEMT
jgi:hypothetical protein